MNAKNFNDTSKRDPWFTILLCLMGGILIFVGGALFWGSLFRDDGRSYSLLTLVTESGYVFDIKTDAFVELSAPISCMVTKDEKTIFPLATIGYTVHSPQDLHFSLLESGKEKELVAIIEQSAPTVILALYDIQHRQSWNENEAVQQELLQRFNTWHPEGQFVMGESIGGEMKRKVR